MDLTADTNTEPQRDLLLDLRSVSFDYVVRGKPSTTPAPGSPKPAAPQAVGGRMEPLGRNRYRIRALDNVSLTIRRGDRVGILGHNGAGKSTLLRVMAGIYPPVAGSVDRYGSISAIFGQTLGMDPNLSGYENIRLRGLFLNLDHQQIESSIESIAEHSELGEYLDLPLRTYSTGMRMRLGFAISTSFRPDCLLLDEWINTGDARFQESAKQRTKDFLSSASALVVVSHNKRFVETMCTSIYRLEHGEIKPADDVTPKPEAPPEALPAAPSPPPQPSKAQ